MTKLGIAVLAAALVAPAVRADLVYSSQLRQVTATTTFDAQTQTSTAPDFGAFSDQISLSVQFPGLGGTTGVNSAQAGIDCQLDPNRIRASGRLSGSGGLRTSDGGPEVEEIGEAHVRVSVEFDVSAATPIQLLALPRPTTDPRDNFSLRLRRGGNTIFALDETQPAQNVDFLATLAPGSYSFEFEMTLHGSVNPSAADYSVQLLAPAPGGAGVAGLLALAAGRRRRR